MIRATALSARLFAFAFLSLAAVSCSDDDEDLGPNPTLEGTWDVTSFVGGVVDFIDAGMGMEIVLTPTSSTAGGYEFIITNDQIDACDPGPNCSQTGSYSNTSSTITINPGTEDETPFNYTMSGDTMTWTGTIDGIPVTVVLEKQ